MQLNSEDIKIFYQMKLQKLDEKKAKLKEKLKKDLDNVDADIEKTKQERDAAFANAGIAVTKRGRKKKDS